MTLEMQSLDLLREAVSHLDAGFADLPALDSAPDLAVFTSGAPDYATRRLIHGFGLAAA